MTNFAKWRNSSLSNKQTIRPLEDFVPENQAPAALVRTERD